MYIERAGRYLKRMKSNLECPGTTEGISISQVQEEALQILGKFPKIEEWSRDGIEFGVSGILGGISISQVQDKG